MTIIGPESKLEARASPNLYTNLVRNVEYKQMAVLDSLYNIRNCLEIQGQLDSRKISKQSVVEALAS